MSKSQLASYTLSIVLLGLIQLAPSKADAQKANQDASNPLPSVIVQDVVEKDVTPEFRIVGRVVATDTVEIRARIEGILEKRNFIEGSTVKENQLLFEIEREPYQVVVDQRKAELAGAEANKTNADADFKRKESLVGRRVVSEASLDESRAAMLSAEAEVLQARAALRAAELDLSYTEIKSPITGKISLARYSVGNLVNSGSEPLAVVTSVDPVYVKIGISEKMLINARRRGVDMQRPKVDPRLRLSDGTEYNQTGKFNYMSPDVDQSTDTIIARAEFQNPQGVLLPGQFVTVVIRPKQTERSIVVPQVAVQRDAEGYFVLVVDRENKVEVRRIEATRQVETDWVVTNGLATGERIIVDGIQKVRPDMVVNPVKAS
ncbi:MAG: efflux RND transporter periplasmic adaptor subunit [Hyphomicrobiaceae bacterium]